VPGDEAATGGGERREGRVRVLVADAQPMYLEALERAIREWPEFELVGVVGAEEFVGELRRVQPDVALVDPDALGSEDTAAVLDLAGGRVRLLFLSAEPDPSAIYRAIECGVAGYLSKDCDARDLCHAISAAARGRDILSPAVQPALVKEIRLRSREDRPFLTEREQQILRLVGEGRSAPQIARELQLAPSTIKTHLHHIYEKLGVSERAEAVREAMRRGLIE
jgi:two-component system nitrate/nitrite response regulator NarL